MRSVIEREDLQDLLAERKDLNAALIKEMSKRESSAGV